MSSPRNTFAFLQPCILQRAITTTTPATTTSFATAWLRSAAIATLVNCFEALMMKYEFHANTSVSNRRWHSIYLIIEWEQVRPIISSALTTDEYIAGQQWPLVCHFELLCIALGFSFALVRFHVFALATRNTILKKKTNRRVLHSLKLTPLHNISTPLPFLPSF